MNYSGLKYFRLHTVSAWLWFSRHTATTLVVIFTNHSFPVIHLCFSSPIALFRDAGKDAKPSPSPPAQVSQHRYQKTRHGSRSRSRSRSRSSSPRLHYGSGGRMEKRSSRSRSPHSSRYARRSVLDHFWYVHEYMGEQTRYSSLPDCETTR